MGIGSSREYKGGLRVMKSPAPPESSSRSALGDYRDKDVYTKERIPIMRTYCNIQASHMLLCALRMDREVWMP